MARNFSEDGALGAMSAGGTPNAVSPGKPNNFNMTGTPAGASSSLPFTGSEQDSSPGAISTSDVAGTGGYGGFGGEGSGGGAPASPGMGGGWGGGGLAPMGMSFAAGGAIDEDPNATDPQGSALGASLQASINKALSTVQNTLSYGRQLHGLGGGQQQAMNDSDFRKSDNIEDRRDGDDSGAPVTGLAARVNGRMNQIGNRISEFSNRNNQMSKDAGMDDIGSAGGAGQSDQGEPQKAIQDDDEGAQ